MSGTRNPGAAPRLVVPEGLVIDVSARERLERQLADAAPAIAGIGAECSALAPGASYRVHAEWSALDSTWSSAGAAGTATARPVRGAVLVRPDVEFAVRDGSVEVGGDVLVDPGAHVHDPFGGLDSLESASERGRPPFPRRPVVVFLACEPPADADAVRKLVNRLVRRDIEARLAVPDASAADAAGLQLTRPCRADEATIRSLAPDVVVTLDHTAAGVVDAWCAGNRAAVVVAFDPTLADPMELVSWQIGHAAGRLRARIGPRVDVPAFAALVIRLCAGPQPAPPTTDPELLQVRAPVREHWSTNADAAPPAGCVVLTGELDAPGAARVAGLADNLEGAGVPVDTRPLGGAVPAAARGARLLLLAGVARSAELDALIEQRRAAGLPTVLDVAAADVAGEGDAPGRAGLTDAAAALAAACGLVVAAPGARLSAARRSDARALSLPTLLGRSEAAALRDVRAPVDALAPRVIGWRLDGPGADPVPYAAAVAEGVARYLAEIRDRVEVAGDLERVPAPLRDYERVTGVSSRPTDPGTIAGWALHVWTPALAGDELLDDARAFEQASLAGVPSIMPAAALSGVDGYVNPHVLVESVDDAGQWYDAVHHVFDDPIVRARRADEAGRRADSVDGAAACKAVVSRLLGWASYR